MQLLGPLQEDCIHHAPIADVERKSKTRRAKMAARREAGLGALQLWVTGVIPNVLLLLFLTSRDAI
jgi:hypothetical protein